MQSLLGAVRDTQPPSAEHPALQLREAQSREREASPATTMPLGRLLSIVLASNPPALLDSQKRVLAVAPSSPPTSRGSSEEVELDGALRSLLALLAAEDESCSQTEAFVAAVHQQLRSLIATSKRSLHCLLAFALTTSSSVFVAHAQWLSAAGSSRQRLQLLLVLQFVVDRYVVEQRPPPEPLPSALAALIAPLCHVLHAVLPLEQPTVLAINGCLALVSLLHLVPSATSLPASFSALCRALAATFRASRPLLSAVFAALSTLHPSPLSSASPAALSSLYLTIHSSLQSPSSDMGAKRISTSLHRLSALHHERSAYEAVPSVDVVVAVLAVAASWGEVRSKRDWERVWVHLRVSDVRAVIAVWNGVCSCELKAVRPVLRRMLHAYIAALVSEEKEDDEASSGPTPPAPRTAPLSHCFLTDPPQARCEHVLSVVREALSTTRRVPASFLDFLAAQFVSHRALSSRIPALLATDFLDSDDAAVSRNTTALLSHLYRRGTVHRHLLLPPLLAAYPRSPFDLSPLFCALSPEFSLPALIAQLYNDRGDRRQTPAHAAASTAVIDAVLSTADDPVSTLTAVIDAFNNSGLPPTPPPVPQTPSALFSSSTPPSTLSSVQRTDLLHFIDVTLAVPTFAQHDCGAAVAALLCHLAAYPSSSLHLTVVTHLQGYLDSHTAAQDAVLAFCVDRIEQRSADLAPAVLDEASKPSVRSSLLFIRLFPILVLRSLHSTLFGARSWQSQQRLLPLLLKTLDSRESAQLKTVTAEVIARLHPALLFDRVRPKPNASSAFVLCSAFAHFTALNQTLSAERAEERRLLFSFDPQRVAAALHSVADAIPYRGSSSDLVDVVPCTVAGLLRLLVSPSLQESETAATNLRHGVVDTLSNVLVASSSYRHVTPDAPSLLRCFLDAVTSPLEACVESKEKTKEPAPTAGASSSFSRALSASVRLTLLHVLAYTLTRLGALVLSPRSSEQAARPGDSDVRFFRELLDGFAEACVRALTPVYAASAAAEEQTVLLRVLFTAAYQHPAVLQEHASPLLAIVHSALAHVDARVEEVDEGATKDTEEEGEEGGDSEEAQEARHLAALKLLGCLLAHAPESVVSASPTAIFEVRAALRKTVSMHSRASESAQLAAQLLKLSGLD